jgi:hypothetical protein
MARLSNIVVMFNVNIIVNDFKNILNYTDSYKINHLINGLGKFLKI